MGASIVVPATTILMASDAEAQQADQAAPADAAPKKKTKKKKGGRKHQRRASGKTKGTVNVSAFKPRRPGARPRPGVEPMALRYGEIACHTSDVSLSDEPPLATG